MTLTPLPLDCARSKARLTLLLFVLAAAIYPGCGGGGGGAGAGSVAIDDYIAKSNQAFCERVVACGEYPDQDACEASVFASDLQGQVTLIAAVKRGTISYDGKKAATCLQTPRTDCNAGVIGVVPHDACVQTFAGKLAVGSVCVIDTECANDGRCVPASSCSSTTTCCPGTCVAATPAGGDCSAGDACAPGTFCQAGATCATLLPAGSPCQLARECASGFCQPDPAGLKCADPAPEGAACDPNDTVPCLLFDDYCDPTTLVCAKRTKTGAACAGETCALSATCQNGTCQIRPAAGQACDPAGVRCLGLLVCVSDTCAPPTPGQACVPATL